MGWKCCRCLCVLNAIIIIVTVAESGVPTVKVKCNGTAVLPCSGECSREAIWTVSNNRRDPLAECDQTECRSIKEGYQMIYNQYLQGNFSLIINKADHRKRALYTCECDGTDLNDVQLLIEPRKDSVQLKPGEALRMDLKITDPVEVIYRVNGSSDQICKVDGGLLQCKSDYINRTSLSSSVLELRGKEESNSGVYIVRDSRNKEDVYIFNVTVQGDSKKTYPGRSRIILVVVGVLGVIVIGIVIRIVIGIGIIRRRRKKNGQYRMKNGQARAEMNGYTHHNPEEGEEEEWSFTSK